MMRQGASSCQLLLASVLEEMGATCGRAIKRDGVAWRERELRLKSARAEDRAPRFIN